MVSSQSIPHKVLVVGGSADNQLGTSVQKAFRHAIFRYYSWSLQQVATCREALRLLRQQSIPVVISWRELPDGSWRELLYQIRSLIHPPPPLIVSYEPRGRFFWSEVFSLGGYDILVKPFEPLELFRLVNLASEQWKEEQPYGRRIAYGYTGKTN